MEIQQGDQYAGREAWCIQVTLHRNFTRGWATVGAAPHLFRMNYVLIFVRVSISTGSTVSRVPARTGRTSVFNFVARRFFSLLEHTRTTSRPY